MKPIPTQGSFCIPFTSGTKTKTNFYASAFAFLQFSSSISSSWKKEHENNVQSGKEQVT